MLLRSGTKTKSISSEVPTITHSQQSSDELMRQHNNAPLQTLALLGHEGVVMGTAVAKAGLSPAWTPLRNDARYGPTAIRMVMDQEMEKSLEGKKHSGEDMDITCPLLPTDSTQAALAGFVPKRAPITLSAARSRPVLPPVVNTSKSTSTKETKSVGKRPETGSKHSSDSKATKSNSAKTSSTPSAPPNTPTKSTQAYRELDGKAAKPNSPRSSKTDLVRQNETKTTSTQHSNKPKSAGKTLSDSLARTARGRGILQGSSLDTWVQKASGNAPANVSVKLEDGSEHTPANHSLLSTNSTTKSLASIT